MPDPLVIIDTDPTGIVATHPPRVALQRQSDEGWDSLQLWTFQVNDRARAFYARHGFREVELTDGATNEEHEPDVRLLRP